MTEAENEGILETESPPFPIDFVGKTVTPKARSGGLRSGDAINTDPSLVLAAPKCFRRLEPKSVLVAEDIVDLNWDELAGARLRASYSGLKHLWLPRTVLEAEFVVSM